MNKKTLREQARQRRNALSPYQQKRAANALAGQIARLPAFHNAKSVALYLANDGEIDPLPTLALAEAAGKRCYLPVLHPLKHNRLHFAPYRTGGPLKPSYYGYPEPPLRGSQITPAWTIDLILLPLVAFDARGHRLGMGGGFYDRTLAFTRTSPRRPTLIGLAHNCQQLEHLAEDPWDIPLDAIATDKAVIMCPPHKHKQKSRP